MDDVSSDATDAYLAALKRCKGKLSDDDDGLLKLHYVEELSTRQIAERMGRPQSSVCHSPGPHSALAVRMHPSGLETSRAGNGGCVMSDSPAKIDGLLRLAEEVCAETVSAEDLAALDALLLSGSEFRRDYLDYCTMHMALGLELQAEREVEKLCGQIGAEGTPVDPQSVPYTAIPVSPIAPISPGSFSPFLHDAVVHFSSGWPAAYVIATAIFAIGLIVGALVHVSAPVQYANPARSDRLPSPQSQNVDPSSIVGRITGMVDCVWEESSSPDQKSEIRNQESVLHLGDTLALRSGLVEIAYDTGARVILQGPVTYEVESPAGGYLAIGRLTARLDSHSEISNLKSQIQNQKSEILNHKFAVRTPTAIVTDLGTEFGVEVSRTGETMSHVFRGTVEVRPTGDGRNPAGQAIRLTANESVKVGRSPHATEIRADRAAIDPAAFVRPDQLPKLAEQEQQRKLSRWRAYSRQLQSDPAVLAYYTFESPGPDKAVLSNLSRAGSVLDGRIEGATWADGRLAGKRSLYFHGTSSLDKVILPEQERFKFSGPFSLAVWFKVERFSTMTHTLVAKGVTSWQLHQDKRTKRISFDTSRDPFVEPLWDVTPAPAKVDDGMWHFRRVGIRAGRRHRTSFGVHRWPYRGQSRLSHSFSPER